MTQMYICLMIACNYCIILLKSYIIVGITKKGTISYYANSVLFQTSRFLYNFFKIQINNISYYYNILITHYICYRYANKIY